MSNVQPAAVAETLSPVTNTNTGAIAPQATSTIGTPEPPPQTLSATGGISSVVRLNPYGPDNRLDAGGIVFSYPDLLFDQFVEIQEQVEITDDTEPGTVLLQIPYDPLSQYMNPYIRRYASLHGRYNGSILVRCFMIGNATYSGTIMWFWYPRKYPNRIANFYEAQKYAYKTQSVVMPSVEEFVLEDARQTQFYRTTDSNDVNERPHLVLMVHTSVVSPLKQGIKVRLRIATRLASKTDAMMGKMCKPFMFADPLITPFTPGPTNDDLVGKRLGAVFPYYGMKNMYMVMDGTYVVPDYDYTDTDRNFREFSLKMIVPALVGGAFNDTDEVRLVSTDYEGGVFTDKTIRIAVLVHQLPLSAQKRIAQKQEFRNICKQDHWLDELSGGGYLANSAKVYVARNNAAKLIVFKDKKSKFQITIVQQTYFVTRLGIVLATAFEVLVPSNDLKYAALGGVPDTPTGRALSFPFNPILGPVTISDGLRYLPPTWVGLKILEFTPGIINNADELAPSVFTAAPILEYFKKRAEPLDKDQVIQFDLLDPTSQSRVVTLRYIKNLNEFAVSPMDKISYRQYAGDVMKLQIAGYGLVPATTSFPMSDTSNWPKRFGTTSIAQSKQYLDYNPKVKPNAAIAAVEVLEGLAGAVEETSGLLGGVRNASVMTEETGADFSNINTVKAYRDLMSNRGISFVRQGMSSVGTQATTPLVSRGVGPANLTRESTAQTLANNYMRDSSTQVLGQGGRSIGTQIYNAERTSSTQTPISSVDSGVQVDIPSPDTWYERLEDMDKKYSPKLGITPLAYISSQLRNVYPNGNLVTSGVNWGRDYQLTTQMEEFQSGQNQLNRQQQMNMLIQNQRLQKYMQQRNFDFQGAMQNRAFDFKRQMQQGQFEYGREMQSNQFDFEKQLSGQKFQQNLQLGNQAIKGALENTVLGGAATMANTVLSKTADVYLQQQQFHNQQSLMTQNYNQSLQASGARAQAMQLAS